MEYRRIGRTEMSASVIGLGTEHLDRKPPAVVEETIHAALDMGINMMDLFMPGEEVRRNIGRALAGRREKMLIQGHIGSVDLLYNFAGMVSDSRKILSYASRFEMFRRVLCDVVGTFVLRGQMPQNLAEKLVRRMSYEGPKSFYGL